MGANLANAEQKRSTWCVTLVTPESEQRADLAWFCLFVMVV